MKTDSSNSPQDRAQAMARLGRLNLKLLLIGLVLFGIAYYVLTNFLPYHEDPILVRHAAAKRALVTCERQVATARPGIGKDALLAQCDCASQRFADHLTDAEIKPLLTHKEESAPPFAMTPAFQAHLDGEIASCAASTSAP